MQRISTAVRSHSPLRSLAAMCVLLLAGVASPSLAEEGMTERIDLDPVLQGVWRLHATSSDEGKTIESLDPPEVFCRAYATKLKFADGTVRQIESVYIVKDDEGNPANIALLDNGVAFGFSKPKDSPFVLVQIMVGGKETSRLLITVHE